MRQGQFLLLLDGVNELPSPEARRNLQKFRQDFHKTTPMIFTTRDLGVGGDLEISKKLEMQPLTETQMRDFDLISLHFFKMKRVIFQLKYYTKISYKSLSILGLAVLFLLGTIKILYLSKLMLI